MEQIPGTPPDTTTGTPDSNDRNWAMAMHLVTLVVVLTGGWLLNLIVPLVGLLWKRDASSFIADHAREQLNFQISLTIYMVAAIVLTVLTLGLGLLVIIPIGLALAIVVIVVMIKAALAASRGEQYRFPLTMRLVS